MHVRHKRMSDQDERTFNAQSHAISIGIPGVHIAQFPLQAAGEPDLRSQRSAGIKLHKPAVLIGARLVWIIKVTITHAQPEVAVSFPIIIPERDAEHRLKCEIETGAHLSAFRPNSTGSNFSFLGTRRSGFRKRRMRSSSLKNPSSSGQNSSRASAPALPMSMHKANANPQINRPRQNEMRFGIMLR